MRPANHRAGKTLGPRSALLVTTLHERNRRIFTLAEVAEITGLEAPSTRSLLRQVVDRGVAARLKPGLFILVPFELGRAREYLGNPYVVARELMAGRPYFISHASAMDLHGMLAQPRLAVHVTSTAPMRGRSIFGMEYSFVRSRVSHFFGTADHWVDKEERVLVSDLERTVLDGLLRPDLCGGITEVGRGLWTRRADLDARKLVQYALRLRVGAVLRRLGYLLETYDAGAPREIARLRRRLTATYALLDPLLPREGKFLARWRLRLNVGPEELRAVVAT